MRKEDCKGCMTKTKSGDDCIWFHESLECPCATCLIKVMCSFKCEVLDKHTVKVYKVMGITTLKEQVDYIMNNKYTNSPKY